MNDQGLSDFLSAFIRSGTGHADVRSSIYIFALIAARILAIINVVPFLGSKNAPGPVKIGLTLMLSAVLWPAVKIGVVVPLPTDTIPFALLLLKEFMVGFAIGLVTAEIFYMAEIAGQFIDIARGTNQIQLMVPELGERSSAIGDFNFQFLIALFLAADFHILFFYILGDSFALIPVAEWPHFSHGTAQFADAFIRLLSHVFYIGVLLAAPIILVCLIFDIAFGLINRVAPQINAYFMSLPAKALGGMAIFFFALSMTVQQLGSYSGAMLKTLQNVIKLLS